MRNETIEIDQKPSRFSLIKVLSMFLLVVLQLSFVSAGVQDTIVDKFFQPIYDGTVGIVGQIFIIFLVTIAAGKAATVEGIPTAIKAIITIICFTLCVAIACSITTWGVGGKVQSMIGNIKFW